MRYVVLFEHSETNWSAYVPDLPGCIAAGRTKAETEKLIREAIEFHIEGMRLDGEPIPPPTIEVEYVSIPA
ncbi:MAG: type II toxin-antitoxin system HicB family antitoxin [Acidobacteriaceae bacterium]